MVVVARARRVVESFMVMVLVCVGVARSFVEKWEREKGERIDGRVMSGMTHSTRDLLDI